MTDALTKPFEATVQERLQRDPEFRAALEKEMAGPSLEIREEAVKLFTAAWASSEKLQEAEDAGVTGDALYDLEDASAQAWEDYSNFCDQHECDLMTEPSGGVFRCAETNIPLVDMDECVETSDGKLIRVKQAA